MKYLYLILLILSFNFLKTYGQTPAAEVKNLAKKFENKEFDIYSYKKKADIWHEINSKYSYPLIPYDSLYKGYRYQFIIEFDNLDKNIIYNRILEFMAIAQGRRSYSFDYQDYDLGKLVVTVKNKYSDENGTAINFRYIYRITVVDKKARFEIFNIGVEYIYDNYDDGTYIFTNYTKDYNLNEFFPITDLHHKHWEEQLKALSSLDRSIKDGCLEMIGFIKNFEEDYNF